MISAVSSSDFPSSAPLLTMPARPCFHIRGRVSGINGESKGSRRHLVTSVVGERVALEALQGGDRRIRGILGTHMRCRAGRRGENEGQRCRRQDLMAVWNQMQRPTMGGFGAVLSGAWRLARLGGVPIFAFYSHRPPAS